MKIELPEIRPEERTPLVEALLGLIRQLADRVAELERINQELRDEIARSKGPGLWRNRAAAQGPPD